MHVICKKAFTDIAHDPKAVILGMFGQLIILPALAFSIAWLMKLPPVYFMGLVLVACCPEAAVKVLGKRLPRILLLWDSLPQCL